MGESSAGTGGNGAGIYIRSGDALVARSAIVDNSDLRGTGGIDSGAYTTIVDSTISGNDGTIAGGIAGRDLIIRNSTVTNNYGGDLIDNYSGIGGIHSRGTLDIANSIVAGNRGAQSGYGVNAQLRGHWANRSGFAVQVGPISRLEYSALAVHRFTATSPPPA